MKYFVRVDYIFKGSPVQRLRSLCHGYADVVRLLGQYSDDDFIVLAVRIERCN